MPAFAAFAIAAVGRSRSLLAFAALDAACARRGRGALVGPEQRLVPGPLGPAQLGAVDEDDADREGHGAIVADRPGGWMTG